ncbi:hypothetical protein VF14_36875 [Nostoc linckia z18]|nr:hypothetical protein VF14_36875 [Nostoc linckia z18]
MPSLRLTFPRTIIDMNLTNKPFLTHLRRANTDTVPDHFLKSYNIALFGHGAWGMGKGKGERGKG